MGGGRMFAIAGSPTFARTTPSLRHSRNDACVRRSFSRRGALRSRSALVRTVRTNVTGFAAVITCNSAGAARRPLFARRSTTANLSRELVDGSMQPIKSAGVRSLQSFLRLPKILSEKAAIFGLELTDNLLPSHGSGIVIDGIKERQSLELESQHVAVDKTSSNNGGQVGGSKARPGDAASHFDDFGPESFDILSRFLKKVHLLEIVDESAHGRSANLLNLRNDSGVGNRSIRSDSDILFNSFPKVQRNAIHNCLSAPLEIVNIILARRSSANASDNRRFPG